MTKITDLTCRDDDGNSVPCDAYGNNAAIQCECGFPVLIVTPYKRGVGEDKAVKCRGPQCDKKVWVDISDGRLIRHTALRGELGAKSE